MTGIELGFTSKTIAESLDELEIQQIDQGDGTLHLSDRLGDEPAKDEDLEMLKILDTAAMLDAARIMDVVDRKSKNDTDHQNETGEHKFWEAQHVPQRGARISEEDGPIEPSRPPEEVKQTADTLPKELEWSFVDMNDEAQASEVYHLLLHHYAHDPIHGFPPHYSIQFLQWALMPPGYHMEWHIGVRVQSSHKLVAFISGIPLRMRVRENSIAMVEINFLCVHQQLRSKGLAPVLIKEVSRQSCLKGVFQAVYTSAALLPTPISTCNYFNRSLNIPKLVELGFTTVPRYMTQARMISRNKLADNPVLGPLGLREMEAGDIDDVCRLFERYMKRFKLVPEYGKEELQHIFLGERGTGEPINGRREGQLVWSFVVENPDTKAITDFFTFFSMGLRTHSEKHPQIDSAQLFYYATDVAFEQGIDQRSRLRQRLLDLIGDAIIIAVQAKFDLFVALTLMDNHQFLGELRFWTYDFPLNYYLYNYRTAPLEGSEAFHNYGLWRPKR